MAFPSPSQIHSAGAQLFLQESIAKDFIQRLKHRMGQLRLGDSLDKITDVGPLASEKQRNFIESLVEEARDEGAEVNGKKSCQTDRFYGRPLPPHN